MWQSKIQNTRRMGDRMKPLSVLSLFDGISCGQVALERAGIPVEVYYASEIDKYAIQITQKNYPNTIQLGDVTKIDFTQFIGKIDLIMGGSPCQDLSIAGKRKGLSGERSGLFYKFVEAIKVIKPKYFLLENNVGMPKEAYEEISRLMGCYPIEINSALVSAQTRKRFYWTNIGPQNFNLFGFPTVAIEQPQNKGILLKDVLESGLPYQNKADCLTTRYQGATFPHDYERNQRTMIAEPNRESPKYLFKNLKTINEKANALTSSSWKGIGNDGTTTILEPIRLSEYEKSKSKANRVYSVHNKSVTLLANAGDGGAKTGLYKIDLPDGKYLIRKLSPLECERLQTLPDGYTEGVSNTQRYKAIGNGWTVDVIAHIFKHLEV